VGRDDRREERRILDRLDRARLVQQAIAASLRERGAEDVVDAGVVAEVERAREPRCPDDQRDQNDEADSERVGALFPRAFRE
jgi:hypothetical protein